MKGRWSVCAWACALLVGSGSPARANAASEALRAAAAAPAPHPGHAPASATLQEAGAADPSDAAALRGLASTYWLSITFTRGNMTVDDYLGRPTKPNATLTPPPPETVAAFRDTIEKAIAIARQRIAANPKDA